jgi:hypothetical protein
MKHFILEEILAKGGKLRIAPGDYRIKVGKRLFKNEGTRLDLSILKTPLLFWAGIDSIG